MHFARYVQYGNALSYKNPCSGGNEIYNFVWTLLAFSYYMLTLSARCSGVTKMSFNENHKFYIFFIPKLRPPRYGIMKLTTLRLLSLQMQYTKVDDYYGTLVFEMKLLMNFERLCERRMQTSGNRSPG